MFSETEDIRDTVNHLIELCHDAELGYAAAADFLPPDELALRTELIQYSWQRRDFAKRLETELREIGESPVHHGTLAGALHRGWLHLRKTIAPDDRHAILNECARGDAIALEAYRNAVTSPGLFGSMVEAINEQYDAIKQTHDRIVELDLLPMNS
jgi:uncharacterized protein (TIGR02284 family)